MIFLALTNKDRHITKKRDELSTSPRCGCKPQLRDVVTLSAGRSGFAVSSVYRASERLQRPRVRHMHIRTFINSDFFEYY
jgi:hypothetical protein